MTNVQPAKGITLPAKQVNKPVANATPKSKPASTAMTLKGKYTVYIVQPGDTLAAIAQRYDGVTVRQIKSLNRISNSRALRVGAKLKVPVSS